MQWIPRLAIPCLVNVDKTLFLLQVYLTLGWKLSAARRSSALSLSSFTPLIFLFSHPETPIDSHVHY